MHQVVSKAVAAVALAVVGLTLAPSPASAATCSGSSCEGKDPEKYGCSKDATTVGDITVDSVYVIQVRRSAKCKAEWARTTFDGVGATPDFWVESWTYVNVPPVHSRRKKYKVFNSAWTYMVQSKYDTRACMYNQSVYHTLECTGFH